MGFNSAFKALISVLAGNMEEGMLLTAMFKTTHTHTRARAQNTNQKNYTYA
jgi:hypothetical protein